MSCEGCCKGKNQDKGPPTYVFDLLGDRGGTDFVPAVFKETEPEKPKNPPQEEP